MNEQLRERVTQEAEKHALYNALKHESNAEVGAVMGPLMGENPEFREHSDAVPGVVGGVVPSVNRMDHDQRRERLDELAPELLAELDADDPEQDDALPELPNADADNEVRMRVAPNPNGPWHLGHARMPSVIGTYEQQYDGSFLVRFDDTDPETKRPDPAAYDQILEDIGYLGFDPEEVIRASDRLELYYEHARKLIEKGGAYTCSCPAGEFSERKNNAEPCRHRGKNKETIREEFEAMIEGEYQAGDMVLRIKTDIEHKNPALRDWVAFRLIDTPHPREEAADYRCWPMLDFQSGIDDHHTEVSHIIRGIDLQDSAKRQQFVYDYFDWEYPEVIHWGHVQVQAYDVAMSTSSIKAQIDADELDGWDDPRAPTIMSLRRRGIRGDAIVEAMTDLGTSTSNVDLSMSSVYTNNRELVDDGADRRFFVRDGVAKQVLGGPDTGNPPFHPEHEERGKRTIPLGENVLVEPDDIPPEGKRVWLKGFGCVRHTGDAFEYVGNDIDVVREENVDVVHWVPEGESHPVRLRTMEGDVAGRAEPGFTATDPNEIVQFVRVGFARVDRHDEEESVAYFAHP